MAADGLHRESPESDPSVRNAERRRYFFAGVASCLVAQFLIVGGFVATRVGIETVKHRATSAAPTPSPAPAPAERAAALPLPVAAASGPDVDAEGRADVAQTAVNAHDEKPAERAVAKPVGAVAAAVETRRDAGVKIPRTAADVTARPVNPSSPMTTSAPRSPAQLPALPSLANAPAPARLTGPSDWVEWQAELRSALERWVIIEDRDDMRFAEAEVILNSDGDTAKTRVPTARGGGKIVEQRWQRRANGWVMVDVREIAAGKQ